MINAQISVDQIGQIIEVYEILNKMPNDKINIISLDNQIDTPYQNILLYFIFSDEIIGEIELRYGHKSQITEANKLLEQLT